MGTRADFYVGPGDAMEWIGSVAWDGYPDGFPITIMKASSPELFKAAVGRELASRDDSTAPDKGWPWPWKDSGTSDYGYWHNGKEVLFEAQGYWVRVVDHGPYWECANEDAAEARKKFSQGPCKWPDMSGKQRVTLGPRSGIILMGMK